MIYISLEMEREEIVDRIKCYYLKLSYKHLYFGSTKDGENGWYASSEIGIYESEKIMKKFGKRILILDEETSPNIDSDKIILEANKLKQETKCRISL